MVNHVQDKVRSIVTLKYIDSKKTSFTAALATRQMFATTTASQGKAPIMAKRQDMLAHPKNVKDAFIAEHIKYGKRIVPPHRESMETFRNSAFCRDSDFDDELC